MSGSYHIRLPGEETRRGEPHPTWISVGCVLVVGLPALGYLLAEYLLQLNFQRHYVYLPPELAWPPVAPYLLVKLAIAAPRAAGAVPLIGVAARRLEPHDRAPALAELHAE